jgi:hypothetical protein
MLSDNEAKRNEQKQHRAFLKNYNKKRREAGLLNERENAHGVTGEGGLSLWVKSGEKIFIGNDLQLIPLRNDNAGKKYITLIISTSKGSTQEDLAIMERTFVAPNVEVILQGNNTKHGNLIALRVKAPKSFRIEREHYIGDRPSVIKK